VPADMGGHFRNVLTGERVEPWDGVLELARACRSFPVALLVRED